MLDRPADGKRQEQKNGAASRDDSREAPETPCSCSGDGRGPGDIETADRSSEDLILIEQKGLLITEGDVAYYRYPLPASFSKFRIRTMPISAIVLHYTGSPNSDPQVSAKYAVEGSRQASYHFLVGRGAHANQIVQLVPERYRAWHAGNEWNNWSIGIEHAANDGEALDPVQEKTSIALIKMLLRKYKLTKDDITGHRFTGTVTNCPGWLFGEWSLEALRAWVDTHFSEFTK